MAHADLFKPQSEEVIRETLRNAKLSAKNQQAVEFQTAIDYQEGRQLDDTRAELSKRYSQHQEGGGGEAIQAVTIPLVQRFIAESSTLYSGESNRELVGEDGEVDEELTKEYVGGLEDNGVMLFMERMEEIAHLLKTCGIWWQSKRGSVKPRIAVPHRVHPVIHTDLETARQGDPADPEDYFGFILQLMHDIEDSSSISAQQCVLLLRAQHGYYECSDGDPYEFAGAMDWHPNPFTWPQWVDDAREAKELPLQMLSFYQTRLPVDSLILDHDTDIVTMNRELNVQWSALLDIIRRQGASQMILDLSNPAAQPQMMSYGAAFALPLGAEESASFITATNDYTGMVNSLKALVSTMAIAKSQSPSEFSAEGPTPQSGFAKVVESLPAVRERKKVARLFKQIEERYMYPRIASILHRNKILKKDPRGFKLRVTFGDIETPKTVDEITKRQEHDFKHGLDSPVHAIMRKKNVNIEEAEAMWEDHKRFAGGSATQPQQAPSFAASNLFGNSIGKPRRAREDEKPAPR